MGIEHILDLQAIEGNVVTALCDPNENSIKAAKDLIGGEVETFTDHQELLQKGNPKDIRSPWDTMKNIGHW